MDSDSHVSVRSANNFIKSVEIFERDLKNRLSWNKHEWASNGEENSRVHRICNSMHYWKNKLKPAMEDVSIIVTLFSEDNNVRVEIEDIVAAVEKLDVSFHVEGVAGFRNPRYVCLYFGSKEIKDRVAEQFKMMENNHVIYLSWALKSEPSVSKLSVHWMPLTISLDTIKQKLDKYVDIVEEERRNLVFLSGREMPTAKIEFKVKFKKDITAEIIPHLMEINNMEALVTISGRKPLCLNCDRLGHISKDCDLRYCAACRSLKLKKHECDYMVNKKSFAEVVKVNISNEADRDPDNGDDNVIIMKKQDRNKDNFLIEEKITQIQNQMKKVSSEVILLENDRKWKARKEKVEAGGSQKLELPCSDWAEKEEELSDSSMELTAEENLKYDSHCSDAERKFDIYEEIEVDKNNIGGNKDKSKDPTKKKKKKAESTGTVNRSAGIKSVMNKKEPGTVDACLRSYGKPQYNNARRIHDSLKFDKISNKREFVFED